MFAPVLDDPLAPPRDQVRRLLLCGGKISYELNATRQKHNVDDTAIIRVEQLYPVPVVQLAEILGRYPNAMDIRWVQEEPANQGAWPYFGLALPELLPDRLGNIRRVSRRAMAAPSAGSSKVHEVEQAELLSNAFDLD